VGVSDEEIRRRQGLNLQDDIFKARALTGENKATALREIAEKGEELARAASAGGVEFNRFLSIAKNARVELDGVQELLARLAKDNGIANDAERSKTAVASMEEAVDGFRQKLNGLQTEIANANLSVAVDLVDKATGPGKELRDSLQALFASPITQEVIIKQTGQIASFKGGRDTVFDDGIDFQFGDGTTIAAPDSFASGIRTIPNDALVRVHKGERILSRTEADSSREGGSSGRTIQFGDINIQVASSTEAPRVTVERLREELRKLDELDRG